MATVHNTPDFDEDSEIFEKWFDVNPVKGIAAFEELKTVKKKLTENPEKYEVKDLVNGIRHYRMKCLPYILTHCYDETIDRVYILRVLHKKEYLPYY